MSLQEHPEIRTRRSYEWFDWTSECIRRLVELWHEGHSCSEIARALGGGVTRNGVIGKISRLRESKQMDVGFRNASKLYPERAPAPKGKPKRPPGPPAMPASPLPTAKPLPVGSQPCRIWELTNNTCRWPCGDPAARDFMFCGATDGTDMKCGRPYCRFHARMAYHGSGPRYGNFQLRG